MAEFRINVNELKKIDLLISTGLYNDRTEFFNESVKIGKGICEKELINIEKLKKINDM